MIEKRSRSVAKGISWRIIATIDTIIISFIITKSFTFAAFIGIIEVITKFWLYYLHERAWNKINFGRKEPLIIENQM